MKPDPENPPKIRHFECVKILSDGSYIAEELWGLDGGYKGQRAVVFKSEITARASGGIRGAVPFAHGSAEGDHWFGNQCQEVGNSETEEDERDDWHYARTEAGESEDGKVDGTDDEADEESNPFRRYASTDDGDDDDHYCVY